MRELPGAQQSDQWIKNRMGRITASRICDVMSYTKRAGKSGAAGSESAARRKYRLELVAERLTGRSADHYVSPYMEHGTETEDEARSFYEMATKEMVEPVGFVLHPRFDFAGASPDGLVGKDGCLEIKCPKTETLLEWMASGEMPHEYALQVQWELACAERAWCDFYGYDRRLPVGFRSFYRRVVRNDALIEQVEAEVLKFHEEVEQFIQARGLPPTVWTLPKFPEAEPLVMHSSPGEAYMDHLANMIDMGVAIEDEFVP